MRYYYHAEYELWKTFVDLSDINSAQIDFFGSLLCRVVNKVGL